MGLDRKALKKKIQEELLKTESDIGELKKQSSPISPENAIGRVSRMDAINNKSISEASLRQAQDKLQKLQLAFDKVDRKDFGVCVACKKPIPVGRIMLMPQSNRCVSCA